MADSSNPPLSTPTSNPDLELQKSQIDASNTTKAQGNSAFSKAQYDNAIECYDEAYEGIKHTDAWFEQGVLKSNIAACRLKLEEWGKAIEAAGEALGALERADPGMVGERRGKKEEERTDTLQEEGDEDREVKDEKVSKEDEGDRDADGEVGAFDPNAEKQKRKEILLFFGHDEEDVARMRAKALLRRASARLKLGGWAALQGADEDYKELEKMLQLSPLDQKAVQKALRELPPRLEEAKQQEMSDMMGKLKQLGNGILKPFGLSTDNFNMVKDEKTGGYNLQFNQNR